MVSLASPPSERQASVISLENNDDDNYDNVYGNDFETNRKYLTFSWWLLHRGCKEITEKVTSAVKEVFGPVNPREDITLERLSELVLEVRKRIEGATETERRTTRWLPYLLPPRDQEAAVLRAPGISGLPESPSPRDQGEYPLEGPSDDAGLSPSLRRLLDETSDLIDSPTFTHVLTLLLNSCFSHLIDVRVGTEAFKILPLTDPASKIQEITDRKVKVAQTLAVFCRQAHVIAAGSGESDDLGAAAGAVVNEYLTAIDGVNDLEAFAAVIYSSNFEFEGTERQPVGAVGQQARTVEHQSRTTEHQTSTTQRPTETGLEIEEASTEGTGLADLGESKEEIVNASSDVAPQLQDTNATKEALGSSLDSAWEKALRKEDGQEGSR